MTRRLFSARPAWLIPLSLMCWGTLGYLAAAVLHFIGGGTP